MDIFHQSSLIFQIVTGTLPILFVIFLKRKLPVEFVILLSASVITTLILYITAMLGIKNWLFWNLYKIIDIVCITIFYYSLLDSKKVKIIVLSIGSLCVTSIIWELSYFELVNKISPILVFGKVLYTILFLIENLGKKAYIVITDENVLVNTKYICAAETGKIITREHSSSILTVGGFRSTRDAKYYLRPQDMRAFLSYLK